MKKLLENNLVSVLIVIENGISSNVINDLVEIHSWVSDNIEFFEIVIVSDEFGSLNKKEVLSFVETNSGIIWLDLIKTPNIETKFAAGLESCLGDISIELILGLHGNNYLNELVTLWNLGEHNEIIVYRDKKFKIFSRIFNKLFGVDMNSISLQPRMMSREALSYWTFQKDTVNSVRFAHYLSGSPILFRDLFIGNHLDYKLRRLLKPLILLSPKPLRFVSFLLLLNSFLSFIWALSVLIISLQINVVQGWATTNIQIAVLSIFISLSLSILTEFIYQNFNLAKSNSNYNVRLETVSKNFKVRDTRNVEKIKFIYSKEN